MTAVTGQLLVSPITVGGSFPFNGPAQVAGVPANGGTVVANETTPVVVADKNVTANSVILFGLKTIGGTPAAPFVSSVTPGTGFSVVSGASDTSTYNYIILG